MRQYIPLIYFAFYLTCLIERKAGQVNNNNEPNFDVQNSVALYKNFIKRFYRKFKNEDDYYQRYLNFVRTLRTINKINAGATEKVGPNQFADWSDEERYKRMDKMKKRGAMDPEIKAIEDAKLSPPHVGYVFFFITASK